MLKITGGDARNLSAHDFVFGAHSVIVAVARWNWGLVSVGAFLTSSSFDMLLIIYGNQLMFLIKYSLWINCMQRKPSFFDTRTHLVTHQSILLQMLQTRILHPVIRSTRRLRGKNITNVSATQFFWVIIIWPAPFTIEWLILLDHAIIITIGHIKIILLMKAFFNLTIGYDTIKRTVLLLQRQFSSEAANWQDFTATAAFVVYDSGLIFVHWVHWNVYLCHYFYCIFYFWIVDDWW